MGVMQVLNSSPQNRESMVRLISLWRKVKRPSRVLELAKGGVEHYPQDAQLRELYAGCLRCAPLQSSNQHKPRKQLLCWKAE